MNTPNPITQYLKCSPQHNKTTIASDSGVTWQTINKAMLGLYSSIPIKLVNFMVANPPEGTMHKWTISDYYREYQSFIDASMATVKEDIKAGRMEAVAFFVTPVEINKRYKSFTEWRASLSYSQMDFCKTFMLHQGIVSKYESGQMKNLPQSLVDRLRYMGLSAEYINAVESLPTKEKKKKAYYV